MKTIHYGLVKVSIDAISFAKIILDIIIQYYDMPD